MDCLSARQGYLLARGSARDNTKLPLSGGKLTGNLNIGDKLWLDANNEGGNVKFASPDGTQWEMDAYNGNLRIFTHANNVKTGFTIDKAGRVRFDSGCYDFVALARDRIFIEFQSAVANTPSFGSIHRGNGVNQDMFWDCIYGSIYLRVGTGAEGVGIQDTSAKFKPIFASAFTVNSSKRYKEHISPITDSRAKAILDVDVVTYDYRDGVVSEESRYDRTGVEAEKVAQIIPEVVTYKAIEGEKVPDGVDYSRFVPYIIKPIQTQQKQLDAQKEQIERMEKEINSLKNL